MDNVILTESLPGIINQQTSAGTQYELQTLIDVRCTTDIIRRHKFVQTTATSSSDTNILLNEIRSHGLPICVGNSEQENLSTLQKFWSIGIREVVTVEIHPDSSRGFPMDMNEAVQYAIYHDLGYILEHNVYNNVHASWHWNTRPRGQKHIDRPGPQSFNDLPKRIIRIGKEKTKYGMSLIETYNISDEVLKEGYAIVSHTWEKQLIDVRHMVNAPYPVRMSSESKLFWISFCIVNAGYDYFWMDTVCINQEDENEKNNEIELMDKYYRYAGITCVWIDDFKSKYDFEKASQLVFRLFKEIPNADRLNSMFLEMIKDKLSNLNTYEKTLILMYTDFLLECAWPTRVWTFQEMTLSQACIFAFRNHPAVNVSRVLVKLAMTCWLRIENCHTLLSIFEPQVHNVDVIASISSWLNHSSDSHHNLQKVLKATKGRQCAKEHDKIFGIIGLLPYGEKIKVSYSGTVGDEYKKLLQLATKEGDTSWIVHMGPGYDQVGLRCAPDFMKAGHPAGIASAIKPGLVNNGQMLIHAIHVGQVVECRLYNGSTWITNGTEMLVNWVNTNVLLKFLKESKLHFNWYQMALAAWLFPDQIDNMKTDIITNNFSSSLIASISSHFSIMRGTSPIRLITFSCMICNKLHSTIVTGNKVQIDDSVIMIGHYDKVWGIIHTVRETVFKDIESCGSKIGYITSYGGTISYATHICDLDRLNRYYKWILL